MRGEYRITIGNEVLGVYPNLLTNNAKRLIMQYLSGYRNDWAGAIAVGTGTTAAATGDEYLEFEVLRLPLDYKIADVSNSDLIMKATVPSESILTIYELGVFSAIPTAFNALASTSVIDLNVSSLSVTGGTANAISGRVGDESIETTTTASTTGTLNVTIFKNFNDISPSGLFKLAYIADANATNIEVRLLDEDSNYYSYSFIPSSGYNVASWAKSDMTNSGTAAWANSIVRIDILTTAGGTDSTVVFDGFDADDQDQNDFLVSRAVLGTPINADGVSDLQIEYRLNLTF